MTESTTLTEADVITKLSHRSVADTAAKLTGLIDAKGMRLFALIDQREEAQRAGLDLRDTILVIFGSPAAGTPVMAASPLAALDLPLKVLSWEDADGRAWLSYNATEYLRARHGLDADLMKPVNGVAALVEAAAR